MRLLRDNRNIYSIWKRYENSGILRYPRFVFAAVGFLLSVRQHAWDYIREIDDSGCIVSLDEKRYPGIRMHLPMYKTDLIQKLIIRSGEFFEDNELNILKEKYIREGSIICDCGAYVGNHTVFFAKICKAHHIYAFEPVSESYRILEENIRINELTDAVTAFNSALGKAEGRAEILIRKADNTGAARAIPSDRGDIRVMRLDDAVPKEVKVDFVKIDVEGSEYDLLKGAARILNKCRPLIFIEVFPENRDKVFSLLHDYGYYMCESLGNDNFLFSVSE